MTSAGLLQAEDFPVRSQDNLRFAYHVLSAAHDAAEDYMFLSGGLHVQEAGIELYISSHIAKQVVARHAHVSIPYIDYANHKQGWVERTFPLEHAWLEAGGGKMFGESESKQRLDIAFVTTKPGESREELEAIVGVEVKRHITDIDKDVEKIRNILLQHRQEWWCLTLGAIVSFSISRASTRKFPDNLLKDRLHVYAEKFPEIDLQACWLERVNPLRLNSPQDDNDIVNSNPSRYDSLSAYLILVTLK